MIHFESFVFFELKYFKVHAYIFAEDREEIFQTELAGGEFTSDSRCKLKVAIFHANFMQCPIYLLYSVIVIRCTLQIIILLIYIKHTVCLQDQD